MVELVLPDAGALRRAAERFSLPVHDLEALGAGVLSAALIDAHAHLDLSALHARVPAAAGFLAWVRRLVEVRRSLPASELERSALLAARGLLATGTGAVGDIDSTGVCEELSKRVALRHVVYREILDVGDASRASAALARVRRPLEESANRMEGLSPHAPHTVSPQLLARAARLLRKRRRRQPLPVTIHWSETSEEVEWMEGGGGPWSELLKLSPRRSGLDLIEEVGLLGPETSLVHGNHSRPREIERIAASGAVLVHCPGSHAFFGREHSPVAKWIEQGARVALGTDSLASNDELDMRREMQLLRGREPGLSPAAVWSLATEGGARALNWPGLLGKIEAGARADLCFFRTRADGREALLEELTAGRPEVGAVWIGGKRVPVDEEMLDEAQGGAVGGGGG
jgi:cytosine/adenosine deaminase-related metal-dependent hydrolase